MLCISSPELIHLVRESLYPLTSISHFPPPWPLANSSTVLLSVPMSSFFFLAFIYKWDYIVLYSICLLEILLMVLRTWRFWIFFSKKGSNFSGDKWGCVLDFSSLRGSHPVHLWVCGSPWKPCPTLDIRARGPVWFRTLGQEESTAVAKKSEDNHKVG